MQDSDMKDRNTNFEDTGRQVRFSKLAWIILTVVVLLTAVIRVRLAPIPFERDEGEYAYAGQLMLQGIPPYEKAYNMKMPGIYAAYALLLAIFGQTHSGIHLGLIFLNIGAVIFVFFLAKDLFNPPIGAVAAAAYALLSTSYSVLGFAANAEHFVVLPALAGIWLLRRVIDSERYFSFFGSGLLFGLAFMMKQHGAAFIIFATLYLFANEVYRQPFNWKLFIAKIVLFPTGVFLPFVLTCLVLRKLGVFEKFWFWTFDYAKSYVSSKPLSAGIFNLKYSIFPIISSSICLWVLAGVGVLALFLKSRFRKESLFTTAFVIFSFLSICPGLYFRNHYFILFLPVVAILTAVGVAFIYSIFSNYRSTLAAKVLPTILVAFTFIYTIYQHRYYFFIASPERICAYTYWPNPFNESLKIAKVLNQNSQKDDTIAIIGSEPQIYFYSGRLSATSYVYAYPLVELHPYASKMQEEMIMQIEQASPKFLILERISFAWLASEGSDMKILDWTQQYASSFYHLVGVVDLVSREQTVYRWGPDAANYSPQSNFCLFILRHNRCSNEPFRTFTTETESIN